MILPIFSTAHNFTELEVIQSSLNTGETNHALQKKWVVPEKTHTPLNTEEICAASRGENILNFSNSKSCSIFQGIRF